MVHYEQPEVKTPSSMFQSPSDSDITYFYKPTTSNDEYFFFYTFKLPPGSSRCRWEGTRHSSWVTKCLTIQPFDFVFSLLSIPFLSILSIGKCFFFFSSFHFILSPSSVSPELHIYIAQERPTTPRRPCQQCTFWRRNAYKDMDPGSLFCGPGVKRSDSLAAAGPPRAPHRGSAARGWAGCTLRRGRWALRDWLPSEERWMNR